ncbi:MAG: hypothetical protein R3C11_12160 [Planctomycetaceae bacterium]
MLLAKFQKQALLCGTCIKSAGTSEAEPFESPKEPPVWSSCGCGGSVPAGMLLNTDPRILSQQSISLELVTLGRSDHQLVAFLPERALLPETPPPESV